MQRKRSAGGNGNMSGATPACRIKINAAGDWQVLPPAGQITQIGDAGVNNHGLVANDDLFISGKVEANGFFFADGGAQISGSCNIYGQLVLPGQNYRLQDEGVNTSNLQFRKNNEEITIAVGQGAAGVNTAINLAMANCIIAAVAVRVTLAPGGGATTFSMGRTGGNIDEFIQALAVALGTTGTSAANGDGVNPGPVHNAAANTFVITTDANVTISDMKIRITVWYREIIPPNS